MTSTERDKLLTELLTDMKWVRDSLSNHLKHHWTLTLALGTVLAGVLATWLFTRFL